MLDERQREKIYDAIRLELNSSKTIQNLSQKETEKQSLDSPVPKKKRMTIIDNFIDEEPTNPAKDEVEEYLECVVEVEVEATEFDLVRWRENHKQRFPLLFWISQRYLCVPPTTSSFESKFSISSLLINGRRTCLKPAMIRDVMFLKNFYDSER